jgi:hypothetical protein
MAKRLEHLFPADGGMPAAVLRTIPSPSLSGHPVDLDEEDHLRWMPARGR